MIKEKVKTGIPGIDNMLEGGLIPGRPYVVSGTAGTGKTAVAMRFLLEGVMAGEQVLYIAIDEPPNEVRANMESFGWDVSAVHVFDATSDVLSYDVTPIRDVSTERKVVPFKMLPAAIRRTSERGPADISVNTIQEILKQEMKARKYSRVVVDSVTSLRRFYIRTSEEYLAIQSFFRLLSDLGITTLLTVQLPEQVESQAESHMARGELRLHKWFDSKGFARGVNVEKFRGSYHDHSMRPLKLSSEGVSVKLTAPKKRAEQKKAEAEGTVPQAEAAPETAPDRRGDQVEETAPSGQQEQATPPEPPPPPPPEDSNGGGQGQ